MKIKNYRSAEISVPLFETKPGQAWCIYGANRSGIEAFFDLLANSGVLKPGPRIKGPENCGVFSFKAQQELFEAELKKDDTDFIDRIDPGTPARQFLEAPETHMELIRAFEMEGVMGHGFRQLSTGQSRKLMLLSRITQGLECLIIQAPYEGLDKKACRELDRALGLLKDKKIQIIITVNNPEDIPDWATHIGVVTGSNLAFSGPRDHIFQKISELPEIADFRVNALGQARKQASWEKEELVRLENGSAGYLGEPVFTGVDLEIYTGNHTLITGPNGCGKSTLLQVVTGDHPACYQNRLWIFGIQRGTGESIWDLKKKMGIVSADLHRNYIVPGSAVECVLSGLFDSIGLYSPPTGKDREAAMGWLSRINLSDKADTPFRTLSYADQRLVLIARALIKMPPLLILDEPTQGLDKANRKAVLDFLEQLAKNNMSTILYASHREDEFRDFFASRLKLEL